MNNTQNTFMNLIENNEFCSFDLSRLCSSDFFKLTTFSCRLRIFIHLAPDGHIYAFKKNSTHTCLALTIHIPIIVCPFSYSCDNVINLQGNLFLLLFT